VCWVSVVVHRCRPSSSSIVVVHRRRPSSSSIVVVHPLLLKLCLLTKQTKLTAIIQSRRLTLFGHIMRMDDNSDAKRILLSSPPADWRRQLSRPRITWLSTVQQDLKHHHLTLPEAADLAQNHRLWRMMSTYGATQS